MLVIGHRGARGLKPENTLAGLRAGFEAGADMLEFDVRMTSDGIPVLMHDSSLYRTNGLRNGVHQSTFDQLQQITAEDDKPIATLEEVMGEFYGRILLNIELKQHGCSDDLIRVLKKFCVTRDDWRNIVISSFHVKELSKIRKACPHAALWLLHGRNPFIFMWYARRLKLNGVGFNRMYLNDFALEIARKTGLFMYVYTVNRIGALPFLENRGIDAVVTDFPDRFVQISDQQQ